MRRSGVVDHHHVVNNSTVNDHDVFGDIRVLDDLHHVRRSARRFVGDPGIVVTEEPAEFVKHLRGNLRH
ncbi:MAG: hypothetical protein EBT97_10985, partial [Actinobacteria bacterium]|nr:hypothetical protein [Actinomycetota bacterium]